MSISASAVISQRSAGDGEEIAKVGRREAIVCGVVIFAVTFIYSWSKLFYGLSDDNYYGQSILIVIYSYSIFRILRIKALPLRLIRQSVPLIVFLSITLLSAAWSSQPSGSFKNALELIATTAVGLYVVSRFTLAQLLNILLWTYSTISVLSAMLVYGSPVRGKTDWGLGPFDGMFGDKNGLGAAMALAVITLTLLFLQLRGRRRILLGLLIVLCVHLLIGSNSITATVVLIGVTVIGMTAWGIRSKRFGMMFAAMMCCVGLGIVGFGAMGIDPTDIFGLFGRSSNLTGRTEMWPPLMDAVRDHPILGFGYNSFFQDGGPAWDYLASFSTQYNWMPPHAHDSYLQIALDSGLVGLSSFVVALVLALVRAMKFFMAERSIISFWPFATLAFLALGSYDETYFGLPNTLYWIMFTAATLYPCRNLAPKRLGIESSPFEVARA